MSRIVLASLAALTLAACGEARPPRITEVSFARKTLVQLRLPAVEVRLRGSKDADVHVRVESTADPESAYQPVWTEEPQLLLLSAQGEGTFEGSVIWFVYTPPGITVEYEGGSGLLDVDAFDGSLRATSTSGDLQVVRGRGSFDLRNGSGAIRFTEPTADSTVHAETGAGAIELDAFRGSFDLHSASGSITARLKALPSANVLLESASGAVILDYAGVAVAGTVELWTHQGSGSAVSPWAPDREEIVNDSGQTWLRRSYEHGLLPNVKLKSGTGSVEVRE